MFALFAPDILIAWLLASALQTTPEDVLARAKLQLLDAVGRLPKYTCTQTVDRSYIRRRAALVGAAPSCDQLLGDKRRGRAEFELSATDRLRLDVAIADSGREIYAWPGAGRIEVEETELLTGGGPWGTGPFGPFLIDIFSNPGVEIEYAGNRRSGGMRESRMGNWFEYRFRVPLSSSHYYVGSPRKRTAFPYDGLFWLDAASAELKRLMVRTTELPARSGACEATTTIDFSRVMLGRHEFTIPRESRLQFVMRNGDESENATRLSNCHEYSSESVVRFGEETEAKAGAEKHRAPARDPLPPGLLVTLGLETEIDTDTAAAGDPVTARVVRDVLAGNGRDYRTARILVREGALARGRVIKLERQITGGSNFLIALRFETLESNGTMMPLHVKLPRKLTGATGRRVQSRTAFPETGTFVFRSREPRYVLPKGHESTWVTFKPGVSAGNR